MDGVGEMIGLEMGRILDSLVIRYSAVIWKCGSDDGSDGGSGD
jgi:hypothetical protein